jgi:hypothetical protein
MRILVIALLCSTSMSSGFFLEPMITKPGLLQLVEAQTDQRLSVTLVIGKEGDSSRLPIKGMVFDLHKEHAQYEHVPMPGIDGPHPNLSSGARRLDLIKEGHYSGMSGSQEVRTLKGCWEMVWRKDSPAGSLLCGFEVPEEYKRNDATLPNGRIYISFPIWTKDGLVYGRSEKERVIAQAKEHLDTKNEELEKMKETNNPIMKALHYRNAYDAVEKYGFQPLKMMEGIPDADEVIRLQDDLFLTTKGLVWSKALPSGKQVLLGTANIANLIED